MKKNKATIFASLTSLTALGIVGANIGLNNGFQRITAEGVTRDIDFAPLLIAAIDNNVEEDTQRVTVYYEGIPFTFECKNVYADKEENVLVISHGYIQNITAFNGLSLIDVDAVKGYENEGCGINYGTYSGSDVNLNGQYSSAGFDAIEPDISVTNFAVVNKLIEPTLINKINVKYSCGAIEGELTDTSDKYFSSKFHLGTGTKENPYIIGDYDDYVYLRSRMSSSYHYQGEYIKLVANIETKYAFTPADVYFAGTFEGDGHKITLDLSSSSGDMFGLFPYTVGASFSCLKLDGTVAADYVGNVGALVGKAYRTTFEVIECEANVTGYKCVGGIVGNVADNESFINFCDYKGEAVTATSTEDNYEMRAGGIVGESSGDVSYCSFAKTSNVSSQANAGGIVGVANEITVFNCTTEGTVQGSANVGGIAGTADGEMDFCNVPEGASIEGDSKVGGIVGAATGSNITLNNCIAKAKLKVGFNILSDQSYFGGILGYANSPKCTIRNCKSINTYIDATKYVGGIVGYAENLILDYCKYTGIIRAEEYVGGIAGGFAHGVIANSQAGEADYCVSLIHIGITKAVFGGIVGETSGTINLVNAYARMASAIVGDKLFTLTHLGGIVGNGVGGYEGSLCTNVYVSDYWFCTTPIIGSDPQYIGKYIGGSDSYLLVDYLTEPNAIEFN